MRKKRVLIWFLSVTLVLATTVGGCAIYVSDYYRADLDAIAAFSSDPAVIETELDDGSAAYGTGKESVGFIFYPGGKVEHIAYEPLMKQLAARGVLCVLVKMPFNLAVLNVDAASDIRELYPEVESWYIGGHSLGGSMAASHVAAHVNEYRGLVLLGAYSTEDLSDTGLDVLCLYGSEDKVMNREKYMSCRQNLPVEFIELELDGGCHAYFGMYGEQEGDGEPTLEVQEQITITVNSIYELILKGEQ